LRKQPETPSDGLTRPLHVALGEPASGRRNNASDGGADRPGLDPFCGIQQLRNCKARLTRWKTSAWRAIKCSIISKTGASTYWLLPQSTQEQIAIVSYSPFGHGKFPGVHSVGGRLLAEIAERRGRTPRQVALNFLTRHPNVFAIPKTTHPDRVKENAGAVGWKLSAQEIDAIDRAFPAPAVVTALGTL